MTRSLRDVAARMGNVHGELSVLCDVFGFFRPRVPPDPLVGAPDLEVSVREQLDRLEGAHVHLNLIRVGSDLFTAQDDDGLDYGLLKMRRIYATQHVGVGRVRHFGVPAASADGLDHVSSDDEVSELSDAWTGENDGIDVLVPDVIDASLDLLGRSPNPGPCPFEDQKNMDGAVTGSWDAEQTARTMAHEVGHYLGLDHQNTSPDNLMCQTKFAADKRTSVVLTQSQGLEMRTHCIIRDPLVLERVAGDHDAEVPTVVVGDGDSVVPVAAGVGRDARRVDDGERSTGELVELATDDDRPVRDRRAAIGALAAIPTAGVARQLEVLLADPHPSIVRAAVVALGRRGDATTLGVLAETLVPLAARPAVELAQVLIAARTGVAAELPPAHPATPLAIGDGPVRDITVTADAAETGAALDDLADLTLDLDLDPTGATRFVCGDNRYLFVPTPTDRRGRPTSALLGVVASFEASERGGWRPTFFVVLAMDDDGAVRQVQLRSPTGRIVHAGPFDPAGGAFELAAEARPGAAPVAISGRLDRGRLLVTSARAGLRPTPALVPPPLPRPA